MVVAGVERMRGLAAILVGVLLLLLPRPARAGGVEIVTIDGTPWPGLIEQIQDDARSEGRRWYLVVRDGGIDVPCSDYQLSLDAVATAAFRVVGCDASTSATMLRLVNRAALFAEGDVVPRALRATVTANISHHASADGGGAPDQGGSKIWCSVALQPYLSDRLRGQAVPLTPDRFVLRPIEEHIQAAPDGAGWIAKGESRFALRFHYQVTDVHTGKLVLENEASLVCADGPAGPRPASASLLRGPAATRDGPQPPKWVASFDNGLPFVFSAVGTLLVRPVRDIVFDDGTPAKALYGSRSVAVWGGSTLGFSYLRGPLFFPARLTLAGDGNVFALSTFTGVGPALSPTASTTLYSAGAVRYTLLTKHEGVFNEFDGALLLGIRHRVGFWDQLHCPHGWDLFVEAAAPLVSVGPWFVNAGIGESWGPGGHIMFASRRGCR
jgi:hypothetical protein